MPFVPDGQLEYEPWMHDFTAANGSRIHGLTLASVGASGGFAYVADPAGAARTVQRFAASANGVTRGHILNLELGETGNLTEFTHEFADQWFECEMYLNWNSEATSAKVLTCGIFLSASAAVELALISAVNGGRCRIDLSDGTNSSSAGAVFTQNTWKLIRFHYRASTGASDGVAECWIGNLDGSGMTLVHSKTHNITTKASYIFYGCRDTNFTGSIATYVATVATMRQATIDRFDLANAAWCVKDGGLPLATAGISQTAAGFAIHWHPSVYDNAWTVADDVECDIEFVAGDYDDATFPGAGTSSAAGCALPSADEFCGSFQISGLTAGTLYSARIRTYRAAVPGTKRNGPVFQFRTLPSAASTLEFVASFCQKSEAMGPLAAGFMADEGNAILFQAIDGDLYYLDKSAATYYPTSLSPVQTQQEWLRDVVQTVFMQSRFAILNARKHAIVSKQDDHDACEDGWDQGYVKGYVTDANPAGLDGLDRGLLCTDDDLNAAAITRGELYDYAQEAWFKLMGRGDLAVSDAGTAWHDRTHYGYVETGYSALCFLDTRRFQDNTGDQPFSGGAKTFLGADQLAYWLAYFAACTKANVLIFSPANLTDAHLIAGDSWQDETWRIAEWQAIEAALQANANVQRVYLFSGDRHATIVDTRKYDGQWGRSGYAFAKMVGHFRIGPIASGAHIGSVPQANVIYSGYFGATQSGEPSKGYGRFSLNESTGVITWKAIQGETGAIVASGQLPLSATAADVAPVTGGTLIKAGRYAMISLHASNNSATTLYYLKAYDLGRVPVEGTDTPAQVFALPAGFAGILAMPAEGLQFNNGIAFSASTAASGSGGGVPDPEDVIITLGTEKLPNA